ncbi:hypothetical protein BKA66DRAFT_573381 [Pyrenochaeta sp. MPI-SDFR-AT-0127]|nr:hypothetical protein BKA66DRAFT_573381 [Pyrenochaeta sp. MPI-SDFR-AT-0127]
MSGLEIVGIVLGSLPLIVKATEYSPEAFTSINNMIQFKYGFQNIHIALGIVWTSYTFVCERLLQPLAITHGDLAELIENPMSDKWRGPILHLKLKARLGRAYGPFNNAIELLHSKLEKIRKKLNLDEHFLPPWIKIVDNSRVINTAECDKFFKSKWARIKGGFDLEGCLRHILRLQEENSNAKTAQRTGWRFEIMPEVFSIVLTQYGPFLACVSNRIVRAYSLIERVMNGIVLKISSGSGS